jgi:hypothetical protein
MNKKQQNQQKQEEQDEKQRKQKKQEIPEHVKMYIAGFIDGDGSIGQNDGLPRISVAQATKFDKTSPALLFVQKYYGGSVSRRKKLNENRRDIEKLRIGKSEATKPLLQDLEKYSVLKYNQAKIASEFYLTSDKLKMSEIKIRLAKTKELKEYQNVIIDPQRITIPWLAGFFDAEGCVHAAVRNGVSLFASVYQKSSPSLLEHIQKFLGFGALSRGSDFRTSGHDSVKFMKKIYRFTIVKQPEIDCFFRIYEIKNHYLSRRRFPNIQEKFDILILDLALSAFKNTLDQRGPLTKFYRKLIGHPILEWKS